MGEYPKLMREKRKGIIVKFTAPSVGTIVGVGHDVCRPDRFKVGYHVETWNMDVFNDYKPDIVKTKG